MCSITIILCHTVGQDCWLLDNFYGRNVVIIKRFAQTFLQKNGRYPSWAGSENHGWQLFLLKPCCYACLNVFVCVCLCVAEKQGKQWQTGLCICAFLPCQALGRLVSCVAPPCGRWRHWSRCCSTQSTPGQGHLCYPENHPGERKRGNGLSREQQHPEKGKLIISTLLLQKFIWKLRDLAARHAESWYESKAHTVSQHQIPL